MAEISYRDLAAPDLPDLMEIMGHWSVVRQLGGWPWPPDAAYAASRCKPFAGDGFVWAICENDRLIGSIGVTEGDLGYALHPDFHRKGIMTRAVRHAVGRAFATSTHTLLTAATWHDNRASATILGRMGFVHWQTRFVQSKVRGLPVLLHHHRLARDAWQSLRSPAQ